MLNLVLLDLNLVLGAKRVHHSSLGGRVQHHVEGPRIALLLPAVGAAVQFGLVCKVELHGLVGRYVVYLLRGEHATDVLHIVLSGR